jgi:lipopolysaccharide transport system ATP-binding protein
MSEPVIQVENLSKRYVIGHQRSKEDGLRHVIEDAIRAPLKWLRRKNESKPQRDEFWALNDVSFDVKQGDVVGIIGRNGAGKSTLLKILSRIMEPTKGRIQIEGRVASLLEVGTGFHTELTGRENIFLNGAILGMSRLEIKRKFDEIVAFSEVERFLDTPVKRYSSGMYVRLAFAVAAHLDPEILIVDEVLAVGDVNFQKKCLGKMKDVASGGRTVLFVSHNTAAVQALCSRCIFLSAGNLIADGPVEQTIAEYLTVNEGPTRLLSNHLFGLEECQLISSETGQLTRNPIFGRDYTLNIQFQSFQNLRFAVAAEIRDQSGVMVTSINTPEEGHPFQRDIGGYLFAIDFANLALHPGRYGVTIRFCDENQNFFIHDHALSFTVEPENLPGAAWPYTRGQGFARIASESRISRIGASVACV